MTPIQTLIAKVEAGDEVGAVVELMRPHISSIHADSVRAALETCRHGGMVDVLARVDGREYQWEADWLKDLPRALARILKAMEDGE